MPSSNLDLYPFQIPSERKGNLYQNFSVSLSKLLRATEVMSFGTSPNFEACQSTFRQNLFNDPGLGSLQGAYRGYMGLYRGYIGVVKVIALS